MRSMPPCGIVHVHVQSILQDTLRILRFEAMPVTVTDAERRWHSINESTDIIFPCSGEVSAQNTCPPIRVLLNIRAFLSRSVSNTRSFLCPDSAGLSPQLHVLTLVCALRGHLPPDGGDHAGNHYLLTHSLSNPTPPPACIGTQVQAVKNQLGAG